MLAMLNETSSVIFKHRGLKAGNFHPTSIQGLFCMHADKNKLRTINLGSISDNLNVLWSFRLLLKPNWYKSFHDALVSQMTAAFFLSFLCLSIKTFMP